MTVAVAVLMPAVTLSTLLFIGGELLEEGVGSREHAEHGFLLILAAGCRSDAAHIQEVSRADGSGEPNGQAG